MWFKPLTPKGEYYKISLPFLGGLFLCTNYPLPLKGNKKEAAKPEGKAASKNLERKCRKLAATRRKTPHKPTTR